MSKKPEKPKKKPQAKPPQKAVRSASNLVMPPDDYLAEWLKNTPARAKP